MSDHTQQRREAVSALGAVRVTQRDSEMELIFPPLRAAGSALMLAAFGCACMIIGGAAVLGLSSSGGSAAGSILALGFGGVFALPLIALGIVFIAIAAWTAANSLTVRISASGLEAERRCLGVPVSRKWIAKSELTALETRLAAKYVGVFGATRYYRLFARAGSGSTLVADSLKGPTAADEVRNMMMAQLEMRL